MLYQIGQKDQFSARSCAPKACPSMRAFKVFGPIRTKMFHVKHFCKVWLGIGQNRRQVWRKAARLVSCLNLSRQETTMKATESAPAGAEAARAPKCAAVDGAQRDETVSAALRRRASIGFRSRVGRWRSSKSSSRRRRANSSLRASGPESHSLARRWK